jgi:cation:H+ antiporter
MRSSFWFLSFYSVDLAEMNITMIENIALFAFGLFLLYAGAELLVRGSSRMALLARIQPIIVGLTVVAFGTSFPEFLTSIVAAWQDKIDIAIGNIIGSNIANICLILGASGLILPLNIEVNLVKKEMYWMITASILFWLFSLGGSINHWEGTILFCGIIVFTAFLIRSGLKEREHKQDDGEISPESAKLKNLPVAVRLLVYFLMTLVGIAILVTGSDLLIESATYIARAVGVSELVIGLSLVAFGTSLPELATAIIAIIKKENEILIGNIIGSNIFNLLFVGGFLSTFFSAPIKPRVMSVDIPIMLVISLLLIPIIFISKKISRSTGMFLLTVYVTYIIYVFMTI